MLLQLKGKLTLDYSASVRAKPDAASVPYADVVAGLTDMGYERHAAEEAVQKVSEALEKDGAFAAQSTADKEQAVFRRALMELA